MLVIDRCPSHLAAAGRRRDRLQLKSWDRYGLKQWIEAAKKRLHHNVLAIALANKLARIAWAVLAKGRGYEMTRTADAIARPA